MTEKEHSSAIQINGGRDTIWAMAFTRSGEYLIAGDDDKFGVWRVEDGKRMATIEVKFIECLAVSSDGKYIAAGTALGEVVLLDANSYEKIFEHKLEEKYPPAIFALDFSLDSSHLVIGSKNCTATVLDVATREIVLGPLGHESWVKAAKYSPQGDRIALAAPHHKSVRVYSSKDGCLLIDIPVPMTPLNSNGLSWLNDQLFILSDGVVKHVDASTGFVVSQWPIQGASDFSSIALPCHGSFLVCSTNHTVTFWDTSTHAQLGIIQCSQDVRSIALSPEGRFLAIGDKGGKITINNLHRIKHNHPSLVCPSISGQSSYLPRSFLEPVIRIDDAVLQAWKDDRLMDTEILLNVAVQLETSQGEKADGLASRALVRARLQQWNEAMDDAKQSINIRPSLVGYIAKSVVHAGKGERNEAYRSCDIAFEHLHPNNISFLLLFKALIVFMVGEHDDAISRLDDLIATIPFHSICYVAKAYIYFLMGNLRMESSDYSGAIQSFEHAWTEIRYSGSRSPSLISLIFGWKFDDLDITIRQYLCEASYLAGHLEAAGNIMMEMTSTLGLKIFARKPVADWIFDFKMRCYKSLGHSGDDAMEARNYREAVSRYSSAISLNPEMSNGLLIKRSRAHVALGMWDAALHDVNEAIKLDSSSPFVYEMKHSILHHTGRFPEAVEALEMISKVTQSVDPNDRDRSVCYISPSKIRTTIRRIVERTIRHSPRVLIDTSTGRLLNKRDQASSFESHPIFDELVSSMATSIDLARIKHEIKQYFRYVMLSHKWGENEPLFQDVIHMSIYDLDDSPTHNKLKTFCKIVRDAGFNWAWSDTCCINKQDHFILQEALVAMFRWYHGSAMTIVFLLGVRSPAKPGDLAESIWNKRAWTFQEYVAAKFVRFYTEDWAPYLDLDLPNHKESTEIISEMEQATGASAQQLTTLRPGLGNIREKLRLASAREATLIEDVAYSLLGIFSVVGIPPIYGEGEIALGRLLAHILTGSGNTSILAWTGKSGSSNSCLPAHITVYKKSVSLHLPQPIEDIEIDKGVSALRASPLNLELAVKLHDHLDRFPLPSFAVAVTRMMLPCISFKLPPLSRSDRIYRADTRVFGPVEIKTRQDLSWFKSLYLVHPWLDALLGRKEGENDVSPEDHLTGLSSLDADDEDSVDEGVENDFVSLPGLLPRLPVVTVPTDRETRALQLVARLRQPFGALLFSRWEMEYRRVAADSDIIVQIREDVSLEELLESADVLHVL